MKKKIFTKARYVLALVSLVLLGTNVANAASYPDDYYVALNTSATQSSENWFTVAGSYNNKYKNATVYGEEFSSGLKFDSSGKITFTTTAKGTITIIQSLETNNALGNIKFDGTNLNSDNCSYVDYDVTGTSEFKNVRVIKISIDAEEKEHTISKGASKWGCFYVGVTYVKVTTTTPSITKDLNDEYSTSVGTPVALSIVASDATTYQWYKSSTLDGAGEAILGATNDTYGYRPTLEEVGEVYIYCVATNENAPEGSKDVKSKVAKIKVAAAYTATFVMPDDVLGEAPEAILTGADCKITFPAAMLIYNPGKTLVGWTDGNTTYKVNDEETLSKNVTFTAVFEGNQAELGDAQTTVNWVFGKDESAPEFNIEKKVGYYTQKAVINDKAIDVAMKVDATNGKLNNVSQTNCAQVNDGTKFIIPAIKGMVVTYTLTKDGSDESVTFDGNKGSYSNKSIEYTYNGDKNEIDIVAVVTNLYPAGIKVVYPAVEKEKSVTATITEAQYATFYADFAVTIPEDVTAYGTALNEEKTAITLTAIEGDVIPANTAVILYSETEKAYTFTEAEEAGEDVESALTGTTEETDVPEGAYVLGNKDGKVGFYHLAEGKKIGANQAYLTVPADARVAFIGFGDNTVTAIDTVAAPATAGKAYNLNGVQAAPNAKGVVIMDGKKVVLK